MNGSGTKGFKSRKFGRKMTTSSKLESLAAKGDAALPADEADVIVQAQAALRSVLDPLFKNVNVCALVDFPNHVNVGDNLIWLGEKIYLKSSGIRPVYTCDLYTYDKGLLAAKIGKNPILIHGGGNFGDVWPKHENFRRKILSDFPDNPVIQMPQTIHFSSREAVQEAKRVYDSHPDFTLLARDETSLAFARNEFKCKSAACPDSAFFIGRVKRPRPVQDIVYLQRTDHEAGHGGPKKESVDWKDGLNTWRSRLAWRMIHARMNHPAKLRGAAPVIASFFDKLAEERFEYGRKMLGRGRIVITDRLHAHILCLLMGIPHVALDNSYGKLSRYHKTWGHTSSSVLWARNFEEAENLAGRLLAGEREKK